MNDRYEVLCLWQGCIVENDQIDEFEAWFKNKYDVELCTYIKSIVTLPDIVDGIKVKGTGKRVDLIFSLILSKDSKFPLQRLNSPGIKWLSDAIANSPEIYPDSLKELL